LVDVVEQPRIVFESHSRCNDSRRAEQLLRQVLAPARAPGHAWVVIMRIDTTTPGVLHGEGEITDEAGVAVGRRVFTGKPGDCSGLASAVGIWASLVLDAETKRPRTIPVASAVAADGDEPAPPSADSAPTLPDDPAAPAKPPAPAPTDDTETPPSTEWPSGTAPGDKGARREDGHMLELGAGGFLMTGTGGGVMFGASPFLLVEVAKGVFVRPAIAVGQTLPSEEPVVTWAATRFDGCLRVAGLYTSLHGMQLDICGGADVGLLAAGHALPYVAFGPSLDLRGELGGDLAVILRGLIGVNAIHEDSLDTPLWAGRGELAVSWRLR
jgi:hypothetical protein